MARSDRSTAAKGAIDLLEESVGLLRESGPPTLLAYGIGAAPFVLGLMYFWGDMSRSAQAERHAPEAAIGMALLYLWMKYWQAVYAQRLMAQVSGDEQAAWSVSRACRMVLQQTILQPSSLFLLPLSALLIVPFGWVSAFYHNLSVYGGGQHETIHRVCAKSSENASRWNMQCILIVGLLWLFGFFVFLNVTVILIVAPHLLKSFLGIESGFTRSALSFLNTTFLSVVVGLTYMCVNPISKAAFVLRCHYGDAIRTGQDLRVELLGLQRNGARGAAWLLVGVLSGAALAPAQGSSPSRPQSIPPTASQNVPPDRLDRSLDEVLSRREYSWRMPREQVARENANDDGFLSRFFSGVHETIGRWMEAVERRIRRLLKWIEGLMPKGRPVGSGDGAASYSWILSSQALLFLLLALVLCLLALLVLRLAGKSRASRTAETQSGVGVPPDLNDEQLRADQQSTDEWLHMATELMRQGEWRLALRALHLATLSALAREELITLATCKSNHDYERELTRRCGGRVQLTGAFSRTISLFERVWYGKHPADASLLAEFSRHFEEIRSCAR